jgi:glycosyltransferase involved in cell wall biosynthesis
MTEDPQLSRLKPRPNFYPAYDSVGDSPRDVRPTVAVIMRTKNRPLLLHRALSSVLLQRYDAWRLYLVNDGGDRREIEEVIARYDMVFGDRLTVLHHAESLGMERASNAALSEATEDLVIVHDDDDSWHPEFLVETTAFLSRPENRRYVGVVTGCTVVGEKIEQGAVHETNRTPWQGARNVIDFRSMLVENMFPPICLVFRRSVVDSIGGFNGALPVLGDWEFHIRLLLLGDIGFIDRPLANYHHRVAGTNSVYSNTVIDGNSLHVRQNILLRNGVMRSALQVQPEALGLLQPVLHALADIEKRLERIEATIGKSRKPRKLRKSLERARLWWLDQTSKYAPLRWGRQSLRHFRFWLRTRPIRRVIARTRGRIR